MSPRTGSILATTLVVVALSVLSGPLVGGVDLTRGETGAPPGSGSATVRVESVPTESIVLRRGAFGSGTYHLEAPPAVVTVGAVRGNPLIRYTVDVPALGVADGSEYELGGRSGGTLRLSFRPFEISPTQVTRERYDATVAIWVVRNGNEYESRYQEAVTIEVRR